MTHIREHLKNTTKAVIAGDWHGNYSWVKNKAVYMCQRFDTDTIIQLGDFGFIPGTSEFTKLDTLLGKKGVTVFFVDGNHEPFDTYRARPTVEDGFQQLGGNSFADAIRHTPVVHDSGFPVTFMPAPRTPILLVFQYSLRPFRVIIPKVS